MLKIMKRILYGLGILLLLYSIFAFINIRGFRAFEINSKMGYYYAVTYQYTFALSVLIALVFILEKLTGHSLKKEKHSKEQFLEENQNVVVDLKEISKQVALPVHESLSDQEASNQHENLSKNVCGNCNTRHHEGAKFCKSCGQKLIVN